MTRWVGWALLACCALIAVAALVGGERTVSYVDLRRAVAAGDVDEVTVTGGLGEGSRGYATVEVHWRAGLVGHLSEVVEKRPLGEGRARQNGLPVVDSVGDDLTSIDPGLTVHHDDGRAATPRSAGGECRRGPASSASRSGS